MCDNIVLVLVDSILEPGSLGYGLGRMYLGFEPIVKSHDVRMLHSLQQNHLVVNHLLVAFDILLENDLDGIFLSTAFSLAHDPVCTSAQCPPKLVLGPASRLKPDSNSGAFMAYFLS